MKCMTYYYVYDIRTMKCMVYIKCMAYVRTIIMKITASFLNLNLD